MSKNDKNKKASDTNTSTATAQPVPAPSEPAKTLSIAEIRTAMDKAITEGNFAEVAKLGKQLAAAATETVKAEDQKFLKVREDIATALHSAIVNAGYAQKLAECKVKGFVFKLDEPEITYKSVQLLVAGSKHSTGRGGGKGGKTKDTYGMSLGQVFEAHATSEEKSEIIGMSRNQANELKLKVLKRAVSEGKLQPVSA